MPQIDFYDFPKFTGLPNYRVNIQWKNLAQTAEQYNLDLDPDFQRGHVWSLEQQRSYIEFRLRGGMTGHEIYANHKGLNRGGNERSVLVDGKQRWNAAWDFVNNKFPIFDGYYYRDILRFPALSPEVGFILCINDLRTRAEVLRWYLEMNTGGVVHTQEELKRVQAMLNAEKE